MEGLVYLQNPAAGRSLQSDQPRLEPSGERQGKESLQGRMSQVMTQSAELVNNNMKQVEIVVHCVCASTE